MLFIALLAIIVPLITVVGLRLPARSGMTISAVVVALAAGFIWRMTPVSMAASTVQAGHRALTIGLILFGAITLLRTLQATSALDSIKAGFVAISDDRRVQTVLVAFAFVSLLEGASGFGTPAIVAAPLLLVLGFQPMTAAVLALLGDTIGCTFGAVGTPLIVGLENVPTYSDALVWLVGAEVTAIDIVIGTMLPVLLVAVYVLQDEQCTRRTAWHSIREVMPWAMSIGLCYAGTAFVVMRLIGPEFTAILSGAVTLVVGMVSARHGWLLPQQSRTATRAEKPDILPKHSIMPLWRAWLPYGIVIILLLVTRTIPPIKAAAHTVLDAGLVNILGVSGVSSAWPLLYSPGLILLVAAGVASRCGRSGVAALRAARSSLSTVGNALLALIPTLILVQLFSNSGINQSGLASMPVFIGQELARLFGEVWLAIAPALAAVGAFIAGSATVSTLTMGPVQSSIAEIAGLPLVTVLALHMVGAAAGNIIAIHNVVSASAVVGLVGEEGHIIRRLIVPTLGYLGAAMLIGAVLLYFM